MHLAPNKCSIFSNSKTGMPLTFLNQRMMSSPSQMEDGTLQRPALQVFISWQFGYHPTIDMTNQDSKTQILASQTKNTKLFTGHKKKPHQSAKI